jgi:hypothetical protein
MKGCASKHFFHDSLPISRFFSFALSTFSFARRFFSVGIFIALLLQNCLFLSCRQANDESSDKAKQVCKISNLNWLLGTWKSVSTQGTLIEQWCSKGENIFSGYSYMLAGSDTLFSEKIALQQIGTDLYYTPTVSNQNNNQPVPFKFISYHNGEFTFENKEHDFPQRIIYKNPQPDFLIASIQGHKNGKSKREDFNFVRIRTTEAGINLKCN